MRESAIFYRSFYEAIKELPAQNQAEVYAAVFEYALNFKTVELSGISKTIFTLIKPQIDANIKRFKNGSKAKQKQTRSKPPANNNNNINNNDNLNENTNININANKKVNENTTQPIPSSSFSFDSFWNLYNKKVGLTNCKTLWNELTNDEKLLIEQRLPAYIKVTEKEIMYRKDPYTWLMGKHWLDEHVSTVKKSAIEQLAETGEYE